MTELTGSCVPPELVDCRANTGMDGSAAAAIAYPAPCNRRRRVIAVPRRTLSIFASSSRAQLQCCTSHQLQSHVNFQAWAHKASTRMAACLRLAFSPDRLTPGSELDYWSPRRATSAWTHSDTTFQNRAYLSPPITNGCGSPLLRALSLASRAGVSSKIAWF